MGKGILYDKGNDEIFEGEWDNNKQSGDAIIVKRNREIMSGQYRNDQLDGKLKYEKTLAKAEVEAYFTAVLKYSQEFFLTGN